MNQIYTPTRQKFLRGQIDWNVSDMYVCLVDNQYTFDTNHEFLDSIPAPSRIATADIPNETSVNGFAQGGSAQFIGLSSPSTIMAVVIFRNTGDPATSELVAFYDDVVGIPFTPVGLDYFVSQDLTFGGFFRL